MNKLENIELNLPIGYIEHKLQKGMEIEEIIEDDLDYLVIYYSFIDELPKGILLRLAFEAVRGHSEIRSLFSRYNAAQKTLLDHECRICGVGLGITQLEYLNRILNSIKESFLEYIKK